METVGAAVYELGVLILNLTRIDEPINNCTLVSALEYINMESALYKYRLLLYYYYYAL